MPTRIRRTHIVHQGLDVTRKSAKGNALHFAPTWEMVTRHKGGVMSDADYISQYHAILKALHAEDWEWLAQQAKEDGVLAVKCYCAPSKAFCHTEFLIDWACQHHPDLFERWMEVAE